MPHLRKKKKGGDFGKECFFEEGGKGMPRRRGGHHVNMCLILESQESLKEGR